MAPPPVWILETPRRRAVLTASLSTLALVLGLWAAPIEPVRDVVRPVFQIPLSAAGLRGSWDFYAPNPRPTSFDVYAFVTLVDGSVERYDFPDTTDNFLQTHWTQRWAEFEETLVYAERLWLPTARRIAHELGGEARVATVELVRRRAEQPARGRPLQWGPGETLFRYETVEP